MQIKSTWRKVTRQDVVDLFWSLVEKAHSLNLFPPSFKDATCLGLYSTSRSTSTIGVCHWNKLWEEWLVVISDKLLECDIDKIRQILVHEIAHGCTPGKHHGPEWHWAANKLGAQWGYEASRLCHDQTVNDKCCINKPKKYGIKCPVCGYTWMFSIQCKAVKHPEKYQHKRCGSTLVRVEL